MRTVREIYGAYRIMPNLQLHQLRVAAVAKMICSNFSKAVDANSAVLAALFHDMGNIIKFDLGRFPEFLEPEGLPYWETVQREYFQKYGKEQHTASVAIGREIGLPDPVLDLIANVAFSHLPETRDTNSFERKITEYSDLRVSPYGVVSMRERLDEGRARYAKRHQEKDRTEERYLSLVAAAHDVEKQIFAGCSITSTDINDASAAPIIKQLWDYKMDL